MIKTNNIKKGDRVLLRNGWYGTMMDNTRQNTRVVDVEGDFREMGSVYAHDIVARILPRGTEPTSGVEYLLTTEGFGEPVEYTKSQLDMKQMVDAHFSHVQGY